MCGVWDVEELGEQMPARIFYGWQAFNEISPIGQWRNDWQFALLREDLRNVNRRKGGRVWRAKDLVSKWGVGNNATAKEMYTGLKRHLGFYRKQHATT